MMQAQKAFFEEKEQTLGVRLNDVQKQAVLETNGPLLLLASPGSGKTTTIIMRIGYMIEVLGVQPSRIKAVTFSKASAGDMKARFAKFFPHLPPIDFSTIHSLAFQVVRQTLDRQGTPYRIIEESDKPGVVSKKSVLREIFEKLNGTKITEDQLDELLTYISFIKNKMLPENEWDIAEVKVPKKVGIFKQYEEYKSTGADCLLIDFDDMLLMANAIFTQNRDVLAQYQRRYDFYLTDESQDTSPVQHAIIAKLVAVHQNLCVVADEDQAIYSWRGAEPDYLLDFREVYPEAHILLMTQNYRSASTIVKPANQFIKRNQKRYNKEMFTENAAAEPISFQALENYRDQAKYVVDQLKKLPDLSSTAILYRNNTSAIPLMDALDRAGIPFYMKDSSMRFFTHWVVEDVLNFMRLAYNTKNIAVFEKVYRKMNAYVTHAQLKALKKVQGDGCVFTRLLNHVELKNYQLEYIKHIRKTYDSIQFDKTLPTVMLEHIRADFGYERELKNMSEYLGLNSDNLLDVFNILGLIARHTRTMTEFASRLQQLETLARTSHFQNEASAITLTTLHSAKGLEFERVYIIDLIDGVLPSESEEEVEEDARLFYVGITRAIRHLECISYLNRFEVPVKPSIFWRELNRIVSPHNKTTNQPKTKKKKEPKQYLNENTITSESELIEGLKVRHIAFGEGKILSVSRGLIELSFTKDIKKFVIETCLQQGYLERL
ncbi:helicase UvrD [Lysinibacillus contaminans]|uniref:DNA 3'-5' helicase n=1 Tax=Lysinibacillus contaminans TaxID=1293441 RepID=A0ABR5K0A4_9BACI|nr:ATP-dependent helicase [Lysinibacillus contaminans]KOS68213.1 helicase UvrD [Lysinibacillus contaminans]